MLNLNVIFNINTYLKKFLQKCMVAIFQVVKVFSNHRWIFNQRHVVSTQRHDEQHGPHILKTADPLPPLRPLASNVIQPVEKKTDEMSSNRHETPLHVPKTHQCQHKTNLPQVTKAQWILNILDFYKQHHICYANTLLTSDTHPYM